MENSAQTKKVSVGLSGKKNSSLGLSKYILIPLILVVLVLAGESFYYFYLQKQKRNISEAQLPPETTYFEGLEFYEEINGEKHLLTIEGTVEEVDVEKEIVVLKRDDNIKEIIYTDSDVIYLIDPEDILSEEEISFSEIRPGDFVAYNPVDDSVDRDRAIWLIQRQ